MRPNRLQPCNEPGCGALVRGAPRCARHRLRAFAGHGVRQYMSGYAWDRLRRRVLDRDGHRCASCGEPCPHPRHHPVDHIVNLAAGGSPADESNLRTLCRREHTAKTAAESRKGRRSSHAS